MASEAQWRVKTRREAVKRYVEQRMSEREIARLLHVSRSTVWNDKQALKDPKPLREI